MTNELSDAFGHPEERAIATASGRLADRISLRDHVVAVEIGAFQQERGTTQRLRFNLVLELAPRDVSVEDDVDKVLSYDVLAEAIALELSAERLNLLETLAERVALRLLAEPQALRCFVRIEKLDRGPGALGVEIVRDRDDLGDLGDLKEVVARAPCNPLVVFLSDAALQAQRLPHWIDELAGQSGQSGQSGQTRQSGQVAPVILCVDRPATRALEAASPQAQWRIDLLAMEQNAWMLAGRDTRFVVAGSRTEIDWAMRHAVPTVWAPSRMVLDATDPPAPGSQTGADLALWLAREVEATQLISVGAGPLASGGVRVTPRPLDADRLLPL